jgi:hypothetical protein
VIVCSTAFMRVVNIMYLVIVGRNLPKGRTTSNQG